MEIKACKVEFKATGDAGTYEGHFSVFGNVDDGSDVMVPGAFLKTIKERGHRVKIFYAHDWQKLIGPTPDVLTEDEIGLFAKGRLTLDSFWGKEAWALMKDGALNEASIGYEAIKVDYQPGDNAVPGVITTPVRVLKEVKLYEISPVPIGMNNLAEIRAIKSNIATIYKAAIPPRSAEVGTDEWDPTFIKKLDDPKILRLIHAWMDPEGDPSKRSSYQFPHHTADGKLSIPALVTAGRAVMRVKDDEPIPNEDVLGVKKHLKRHFLDVEMDPPWAEKASLQAQVELLASMQKELKEGRMLSTASKTRVQAVIDALTAALSDLNELIAAAEPSKGVDPSTHLALLSRRLRAAEMALTRATR